METIRNHSIMKSIGQIQNFRMSTGDLKHVKAQPQVIFYILKKCRPTKTTRICYLCLNEKHSLFIIEQQGNNPLNQRNELISKCRHKNKFKLMNHKTWPLCGKCPCSEFFLVQIFSTFRLNMDTYTVSPQIHAECGANTFHVVDVRTLLCYFNTIVL